MRTGVVAVNLAVLVAAVGAAGHLALGGVRTSGAAHSPDAGGGPVRLAADPLTAPLTVPLDLAARGPDGLAGGVRPADRVVGLLGPGPGRPAATPPVLPRTRSIRHRLAPTTLVVLHRPAPARALDRLAAAMPLAPVTAGTRALAAAGGHAAAHRSAGGPAAVLGVEPASFREFTPGPTARSAPLWTVVARGEAAVSFALARSRHLRLGQEIRVGRLRLRLGAEADFGLDQAGVVVSASVGRRLGLAAEELLVGRVTPARARGLVRTLPGGGRVIDLEPPGAPPLAPSSARPTSWHQLYVDAAATCPGLSWTVLAAIGQVESADGLNDGPSSAGALGPMQFLPSTWAEYGYDPYGNPHPSVEDPIDAVYSAARLLCTDGAGSGPAGLAAAVFDYNHARWYVREVLELAAGYGRLYGS